MWSPVLHLNDFISVRLPFHQKWKPSGMNELTGRSQPRGTFQYHAQKGPPLGESATSLLFSKRYWQWTFQTDTTTRGFVHIADKEEAYDPTGQTCYMEACEKLNVVPASFVLRQMQSGELPVMHRGLGPQVLWPSVRDCMKVIRDEEALELGGSLWRGGEGLSAWIYIFLYYFPLSFL